MSNEEVKIFVCDNCGSDVEETATACPKCGLSFEDDSEEVIVCPACETEVDADAVVCPGCGIHFIDENEQREIGTCDNCGTEVELTATVCPGCGLSFVDEVDDLEGYVMKFDGGRWPGDILYAFEEYIVVKHKGFRNLTTGFQGDKTIFYPDLTAVQLKKGGMLNGQIQFTLKGGRENDNSFFSDAGDENTIIFSPSLNDEAIKIVDYIKKKILEAKTSKPVTINAGMSSFSIADELLKLKQLLDLNVISKEEFESKKKELLNKKY